ncbi:glutathione S-transferase [Suhomyces tanzawaensis NRRL Y-17324]|uniref:Glutathione S-transferase n=1 Tax=Suhomyces tanzawaensis NRRL Y-17324 TaxID=984487 RepID=A0A1E4SIA4_9ASCO|nr:glutathione S-transferase [Suhomyces tanzawaensis NRRL Y-17324]ODV79248.1 glutathione S-transferase [Suhomyces tanzawaensis NRRL Y-17324]
MASIQRKRDRFVLHWLDQSRSHRIVFLLELLDLDYEVKVHLRHPATWRGPKELFKVHPLGKSPILEIFHGDGLAPLVLAESGFIVQYLIRTYDYSELLTPTHPREKIQADYFMHYAEGTLQPLMISLLINSAAKDVAPRGLKSLTKIITKGLNNAYYYHEWLLNMDYLENQLAKESSGYFVGNKLTGADIMLTFPVYENIFDNEVGIKEITGMKEDLFKKYPRLAAWSMMIREHPVYNRVTEIMDEQLQEYITLHAKKKKK